MGKSRHGDGHERRVNFKNEKTKPDDCARGPLLRYTHVRPLRIQVPDRGLYELEHINLREIPVVMTGGVPLGGVLSF